MCDRVVGSVVEAARARYLKMLTALAITMARVRRATAAWTSISIFAHRAKGITSVGLKAVAFVKDK